MGTRFTDAELTAFVASFRKVSGDPHQDFGDVGFIFGELEVHLVLEELISARKVVAAARAAERKACLHDESRALDEALVRYDALFDRAADE